ncbi:hypothetical protein E2562_035109 [Oryza meyeriana var. granulata]|uniref:Malectin-like domain-containing protein n=1 Tax=Oryza meyeriana var. granulata TaxID=110450 RepID=A0A6G1FFU9_9ORYZ|nr:hypothetical protein E2562_035109 [Oryza meyeriana var. granulata]
MPAPALPCSARSGARCLAHRSRDLDRPLLSADATSRRRRWGKEESPATRRDRAPAPADLRVPEVAASVVAESPSSGFISIDCGIPEKSSYQDPTSSIIYVSDYGVISTGANRKISSAYNKTSLAQCNYNVWFFPDGTQNCYTLRSLQEGNKYFVRAVFYYANYGGLNKLPIFDLYLDVS